MIDRVLNMVSRSSSYVVLVALLAFGLSYMSTNAMGRDAAASSSHQASTLKAHRWTFRFLHQANAIRIMVRTRYCAGTPEPYIERVKVKESRNFAILTALVRYPKSHHHNSPKGNRISELSHIFDATCAGVEVNLFKTVYLRRRARRIALYDGDTSPPSKRWPKS